MMFVITTRVRSTTGGYVFTGVSLLTQGEGVPQGRYPSVQGRYPPLSRSGGREYPKVGTPLAKVGTPPPGIGYSRTRYAAGSTLLRFLVTA